MDLGQYTKKSAKTYKMPDTRTCTVCHQSISKEDTPRHLYYSSFCSEECKEKYLRPL